MRYLLIVAMLALTCSAFAQNPSSTAPVQLSIAKYVTVWMADTPAMGPDLPQATWAMSTGAFTFTRDVLVQSNCVWNLMATETDLTNGAKVLPAGAPVLSATTGGPDPIARTLTLKLTHTRDGLNDPAGTYLGSATVTISAP